MEKIFEKLESYIIFASILLIPVFTPPIASNPYIIPKLTLLFIAVALLLLTYSVKVIITGKLKFSLTKYDLPVAIMALGYIISTIFRTPNKMEALLLPGTATIYVLASLIYYFANQLKGKNKDLIPHILSYSAALYTIFLIFGVTGLFSKIPQLPAYMKSANFAPEGGFLPSAIFLAAILPLSIGAFLQSKSTQKILTIFSSLVVAAGLVISIVYILPGKPLSPRFPSYAVSWNISVDALKNSPILGIGPGNYLTAFNRFKPISYNQGNLWAVKFATAKSNFLTLLTEAGLLAAAPLLLLLYALYKEIVQDLKHTKLVKWGFSSVSQIVSLALVIITFFLFPFTPLLVLVFFIILSLNSKAKETSLSLTTRAEGEGLGHAAASKFPAVLLTLPIIVATLYVGFRASRIVSAEWRFTKALNAIIANDANSTYEGLRQAVRLNPLVDRYRLTFSRINLTLANSIVQNIVNAGTQATDQDRVNITTLIQQAISEAKAGVALNPFRAGNWEVLAQTYRAIMPVAQGADAFAIQTYSQAVALDPLNPNLRIALGGIYYGAGDFETAVRVFEFAVATKGDHANARYNLAFAYREKGEVQKAIEQMTIVLSLIPDRESQDYKVAKQALEDLQSKAQAEPPTGEELTPPEESPEPVITPPIELPEESNPPESPISPTPTPTLAP